MRWLVLLVGVIGCYDSGLVPCGSVTCPTTRVCSPTGDRCVFPDQVDACLGAVEGASCSASTVTDGLCYVGVCIASGCGNQVVEPGERCDDGNRFSLDGCSSDCRSDERCGNGILDLTLAEGCDCGDGTVPAPTACNTKNSDAGGASCRTTCQAATCGDGVVDPGEWCDDGNHVPGDGCRADCAGRFTAMASGTSLPLNAVWASDRNNAFAVGENRILHFDGTSWSSMSLANSDRPSYTAVCGTNPTNVFASTYYAVDRYDGTAWTNLPLPANLQPAAIACTATALYVAGSIEGQGAIARWDGTWSNVPAPAQLVQLLWIATTGEMYASTFPPQIFRYTTGSWVPMTVPFQLQSPYAMWGLGPSDVYYSSPTLHFGTSWNQPPGGDEGIVFAFGGVAGDVLAAGVGPPDNSGQVSQFNGSSWSLLPVPSGPRLNGVWGYGPGRAFIVGGNGTILY